MTSKLTKAEIMRKLRSEFALTHKASKELVNSYFDTVVSIAQAGGIVRLPNVGTFSYKYKEPNVHGRNPFTNEQLDHLVGGGYKLRCEFDFNPEMDGTLAKRISDDLGYDVSYTKPLISFIGLVIKNSLRYGDYLSIRYFGTIKKRGRTSHYIYRCSSNLIIQSFPN